MTHLLDTTVVSELRRRQPDPHVLAWFESVPSAQLFLSVLTLGEIRLGIERLKRKDAVRAEGLEWWLGGLRDTYRDHVIDLDAETAQEWGRLNVPDPLPVIDGLLAASAKVRGWALVTRNTAGLVRCGVTLINPFEPPS
ncbi:MAG: type II toxin-antitoxin system VapC family toxin [Streptosporangiaceae bacterium]